ncbi:MAG: hypothetical protein KatS3mg060_3394 [Dehalococcoidia bacterium]|nr:MAG: hypothetical protein KatS3mg060_3394 [Dehalococcoidia bacterium]
MRRPGVLVAGALLVLALGLAPLITRPTPTTA